jgi:hypothetical protein
LRMLAVSNSRRALGSLETLAWRRQFS